MKIRKIAISVIAAAAALAAAGLVGCGDDPAPTGSKEQKLATPKHLVLEENVLTWDAVAHADGYSVTVGSDAAVKVTDTRYEIDKTEPGSYPIYVVATASADSGYKNSDRASVTYVVEQPEPDKPVKLMLVNNPDKTDYFLDETAGGDCEIDATGLVVNVKYGNGGMKKVDPVIGDVDLSEVGEKTVNLSYTEDGVTLKTTFVVNVRERTEADIDELNEIVYEYHGSAMNVAIADGEVTAVDMKGEPVEVLSGGGMSAVRFTESGYKLLKITDGAGAHSFVKVAAAYYISTTQDFNTKINADLSGYFVLRNDIVFEGYNTMIGTAPVKSLGAGNGYEFDKNGYTEWTAETEHSGDSGGVAFNGTLDGRGYTITGFYCGSELTWQAAAYYHGLFGYIGEKGTVQNLTLRGVTIEGGQYGGLVAGVNLGTIKNIVVEADSLLKVHYAGGGYVAGYNGGVIENVVCFADAMQRYDGGAGAWVDSALNNAAAVGATGTVKNAFSGSSVKSDMTGTLGDGWFYINGVGTVYGNADYKKVVSLPTTMYEGVNAEIKVYQKTLQDVVFIAWINGVSTEDLISYVGYDADTYTYTVKLNESALVAGDTFDIGIKSSASGLFIGRVATVTVGEPYVVSANYTGAALEQIVGSDINLNGIDIDVTYSDGTTGTVKPVGFNGYDKTGAAGVAQTVKFFYGEGESDYVEISVTPVAASGDVASAITVNAKADSGKIVYGSGTQIDFDEYFTFTVTYSQSGSRTVLASDSKMTVGNYKPGKNTITFRYSDGVTVSVEKEVDVWFEIATLSDWNKMNENLSGYYLLKNNIDFGGTSPKIGSIVTKVVSGDTTIDTAAAEDTAFTGKFDGNGKTISGWATDYTSGWNAAYFAYSMFAFIGSEGEVGNFTLSNFAAKACNFTSFISSFNKGKIHDVTIDETCSIANNWDAVGAYAGINYGVITDCTCAVTQYTQLNNGSQGNLKDYFEPSAA